MTHSDRANLKVVVFGIWMNGDISIPLVSVLRNGSAIFYSNRVSWLGNKTMASFRLHKASIDDDRVYGCKLDFGAFDVLDSVRLTVIGKNVTIYLPLFIPFIYIYIYIYIYTRFQKGFHIERYIDRYILLFSCTCARVHFSFAIVQLVKNLGSTINFFFVGFFVRI